MQGPGIGDPYIIVQPKRPFLSEVGAPAGRLRIGVAFEPWGPNKVDPEIERELRKTAQLCEQLGHHVVEVRTHLNYEMYVQTGLLLGSYSLPPWLESSARMMGREISENPSNW